LFGQRVRRSSELERILKLPRKQQLPPNLTERLTALLKTPNGEQSLRDVQAESLYAAATSLGLFGSISVGGGKCLGRGTRVLMFNGETKSVEDVVPGDVLMGPDSGPRRVVSTCKGRENLYRVVPVKGDSYVVNESHILSLYRTQLKKGSTLECQKAKIINICVKEYLQLSKSKRANLKGWRTGVDFGGLSVVEPYMLGVWLGDGSTDTPAITTADPEVVQEIRAFASRWGVDVRESTQENNAARTYHFHTRGYIGPVLNRNPITFWLRDIGVMGNKHIPHAVRTSTKEDRLQILAGLLDSDGHLHRSGFDYISKLERLADDVCFLARSLGLAAYKKECTKVCTNNGRAGQYFRVSISGDCSDIPCRVLRKRAEPRRQKKSVLVTGIHLEPLGPGDYFGFELEGADRLFLLADFTVTHNTLISLLIPFVMPNIERALLVMPAALLKKTLKDLARYRQHWRIPANIELVSYESLGRVSFAAFLHTKKPDLIVFDECHKVKNRRAAVTRRIIRYLKDFPHTRVVALSGTVMKRSINDFSHILAWALKTNCPVPTQYLDLEEWSNCLDEKVNELSRHDPGALTVFSNGSDDLEDVRKGVRDWIVNTPGVVATQGAGEDVGASLIIRPVFYDVPKHIDDAFVKLRTKMRTPDDWELKTGPEVWMHARQLALGLFYKWDPRPPDWWRIPRREWAAFVRETLANSRTLDSELEVANACDAGKLPNDYLEAWRAVRDKFVPNVVDEWCDDTALKVCLEWMKEPGIVWVEHTLFGRRLAELSGCKYYGPKGLAPDGEPIEDADPTRAVIASIAANKAGRNLQEKFNRNLLTAPMEGADDLEQLMARTHRPGTTFDEVFVDIICASKEHVNAIRRAEAASVAIRDTTGAEYKILSADLIWPTDEEAALFQGGRWE
jgi:hypothetical protein